MVPTHYKLLFRGEALGGHQVDVVRQKLGQLLKLDAGGLEQLFSGRLITLKRGLGQAEAGKYQALLERLGAEILLQPDSDGEAPAASDSAPEAPATPPAHLPGGELVCPRCGHGQPLATECAHCKMDMRLHLKRLERRARVQGLRSQRAASG